MSSGQSESNRHPIGGSPIDEPDIAHLTFEVLSRADAMGLLVERWTVNTDALVGALRRIALAEIAKNIVPEALALLSRPQASRDRLRSSLDAVLQALAASPTPASELPRLRDLLGTDELARLLGVSVSSLDRYAKAGRPTPADIAERAHFLTMVVSYLRGAYNEIGTQRWFHRNRTLLGGLSPADMLRGRWTPESPEAQRVLELARSLAGSGAT